MPTWTARAQLNTETHGSGTRFWVSLVLLQALSCASAATTAVTRQEGNGPPSPEVEAVRSKVAALAAEMQAVNAAVEQALWRHWTQGAPLDVAKASSGHDALYSRASLALVRQAEKLSAGDSRSLTHLERALLGELLAAALAEEDATVANLEATATFVLDGKEQSWRELSRALVSEKSAVKRRALWGASLSAAEHLDAALARREEKARGVLAGLEVASPLELAAETRELDLETLRQVADRFLAQTEVAWTTDLKRLSAAELKLPVDKLTRANLPRLLNVPSQVDAAFPKVQVAPRAVQTAGALGLYGRPGLTLDLADSTKKNPLPLTVAPSLADVRLSFRPLGGLRDQSLLLAELGTALALQHAQTGRYETSRLGDPCVVEVSGELLSGLVGEPAWLEDAAVRVELREPVAFAWSARRLFALRRAAGTVLARLDTEGLSEADAHARYLAIVSRALGVKAAPEEAVRWRIDTDDFPHAATTLRAAVLAEALRHKLIAAHTEAWWRTSAAGKSLLTVWASGTSLPAEQTFGSLEASLPGLVRRFAPEAVERADGGVDGGAPAAEPSQ